MEGNSKIRQSNISKRSLVEDEKYKRLKEKEDIIKIFESKYIYDEGKILKSGIKIKKYSDNSSYVGSIKDEKRTQKGIYKYANGDVYCGDWEEDEFHGYGVYIFSMGERYEGLLNKGVKEGKGVKIINDI